MSAVIGVPVIRAGLAVRDRPDGSWPRSQRPRAVGDTAVSEEVSAAVGPPPLLRLRRTVPAPTRPPTPRDTRRGSPVSGPRGRQAFRPTRRAPLAPREARGHRCGMDGQEPSSSAMAGRERGTGQVLSPGGWRVPSGCKPGWDWTPPAGASPRLDRVPRRVRILFRTPFLDRYAHRWMWFRGGWDVDPPDRLDPAAAAPTLCAASDR